MQQKLVIYAIDYYSHLLGIAMIASMNGFGRGRAQIGDFEVVVTVWNLNDPNGYHEELARESYTGRRNGLTFEESLLDTPVPPMGTIYRIELKIIADQGVSGEYMMSASLFY